LTENYTYNDHEKNDNVEKIVSKTQKKVTKILGITILLT